MLTFSRLVLEVLLELVSDLDVRSPIPFSCVCYSQGLFLGTANALANGGPVGVF